MTLNIENLTFSNIEEFKKQTKSFYRSLDREKQKYTRRIGVVMYDAMHKNDINTTAKIEAIKIVTDIINSKKEHDKSDLNNADRTLRESGLNWIVGDK